MRNWLFRGVAVGLFLLVLLATFGARLGWVAGTFPRADGPAFWMASRAMGFAAYAALSLEVTLGLFLSTNLADGWLARAQTVALHRWLSLVTLVLVGVHAAALLGDGYVRFDLLDLLVPFVAPYRSLPVALGVVGLYALGVVHVSFDYRARLGARLWRALHLLSFAAFAGATSHGLLAGTSAAEPWARAVYTLAAGLVLWLTFYRVVESVAASRPREAPLRSGGIRC